MQNHHSSLSKEEYAVVLSVLEKGLLTLGVRVNGVTSLRENNGVYLNLSWGSCSIDKQDSLEGLARESLKAAGFSPNGSPCSLVGNGKKVLLSTKVLSNHHLVEGGKPYAFLVSLCSH